MGKKLTYKVSCSYYRVATLFKIELVIHAKLEIVRVNLICLYNLGELSVINGPTKPKQISKVYFNIKIKSFFDKRAAK